MEIVWPDEPASSQASNKNPDDFSQPFTGKQL
jgi:hypothetical protein